MQERLIMITLEFKNDEVGKRYFEFVYEGFLLGGSVVQNKGLKVLRTEISLLDKLEAISQDCACGRKIGSGENARELLPDAQWIKIDEREFDILFNYIGLVPWKSGKPVRHALEVIDWLAGAQKQSKLS